MYVRPFQCSVNEALCKIRNRLMSFIVARVTKKMPTHFFPGAENSLCLLLTW